MSVTDRRPVWTCGVITYHEPHEYGETPTRCPGVAAPHYAEPVCYGSREHDRELCDCDTQGTPQRAAQRAHGTLDGMTPELSRVSDELYVDARRVRAVRYSRMTDSAVLVLDGGHELTVHGMSVEQSVAALQNALGMAD